MSTNNLTPLHLTRGILSKIKDLAQGYYVFLRGESANESGTGADAFFIWKNLGPDI